MNLFPYDKLRPEQDKLISEIRNALEKKKNIIAHAPTGLGKTVAALVPALEKAIEKKLTIFFLTSRHTQHAIAVETLKQIREKHNLSFTVADLVGKKNMCLQDGVSALRSGEFHDYCKKLREEDRCEFYTNTKKNNKNTPQADVLISDIKRLGPVHTEKINELSKEVKVCPYEIGASLAKEATVIIADYSYVFNPNISGSLLSKINKNLEDCIVIIDEAHNLPKRIVDSATERLTTFILKRAIQECKKYEFEEMGMKLTSLLNALENESSDKEKLISRQEFIDIVESIQNYDEFIEELNAKAEYIGEQQTQTFCFSVVEFLDLWRGEDFGFVRSIARKDKSIVLSYKCLDPSLFSKKVLKNTYCTIAMSGTLTPTKMYADMLGFEDCIQKEFSSPFPVENKLSLIVPKTTTKFTERSERQFENIGLITAAISDAIPGNSAIFFPSYAIRDSVYKYFAENAEKTTFLEVPDMSKQDKFDMLERFKGYAATGAVLLGTTSGNFSEGIDLAGDFLKGVVVVGLPLGSPDLETQEAIKYYDTKFGKGWDYAYLFPAFNKVLQSSGRCIRSETDRGVVVYLDERYAWSNYLRCFPKDANLQKPLNFIREIEEFFEED